MESIRFQIAIVLRGISQFELAAIVDKTDIFFSSQSWQFSIEDVHPHDEEIRDYFAQVKQSSHHMTLDQFFFFNIPVYGPVDIWPHQHHNSLHCIYISAFESQAKNNKIQCNWFFALCSCQSGIHYFTIGTSRKHCIWLPWNIVLTTGHTCFQEQSVSPQLQGLFILRQVSKWNVYNRLHLPNLKTCMRMWFSLLLAHININRLRLIDISWFHADINLNSYLIEQDSPLWLTIHAITTVIG